MLIPDLAHQLFQDVLHGDDAQGAAVAVGDHGDVGFFPLQQPQQDGDPDGFGNEQGRGHEGGQGLAALQAVGVKIALMNDAHDVVDVRSVDQQAGKAAFSKDAGNLLRRSVCRHRLQVHPVGEDILGVPVSEFNGGTQQLVFVLVQAALLLDLVHQHQKLLLGHGAFAAGPDHPPHQLFQLGKQPRKGRKHPHDRPEKGGGEHGEPFRTFLGQAFGCDLAENQHHHGGHRGGHRGAAVAQQMDEQQRAKGGEGDVDDVVADENGGEHFVILLGQGAGQGGPFVALFRKDPQTGPVQGGKSGLGSGKIGGKGHQDRHQ